MVEFDGAFAVDGFTEGVDHAADQAVAHRHRSDALGGVDFGAFFDLGVVAHDDDTDIVLLQVEGNAHHAVLEAHQFLRADVGEAAGAGDTVTGFQHDPHVAHFQLRLEGLNLLL